MSERYRRKSAGGQPVRSLQSFEPLLRYERDGQKQADRAPADVSEVE